MKRTNLVITTEEEKRSLTELAQRTDFEAARMRRFLALPDLSRKAGSPIKALIDIVSNIPLFKEFDILQFPEVVSVRNNFDLLNAPKDHVSRKGTDTYYVNPENVLRTQTTAMWPYYFSNPDSLKKLETEGEIGLLAHGKVYRKDEIDSRHMNVFHQIDGLYLCKKAKQVIGIPELQAVLSEIVKALYGNTIEYRFLTDTFPFTDPSTQIEIKQNEKWLEVVGAGVVHTQVLRNLGIDPEVYNGWAFGFGLERLAMASMELPDIRLLWSDDERVTKQLTLGNKFKEVSKYPAILRDISFIVPKTFVPNNYFDLIRDIGGDDIIEEVSLLDKYENDKKFGADKMSYTYRIIYRSLERTLTNEEIEPLQNKIIEETKQQFKAEIR
jgi:phenylalanyl-tRNA synthetase alpha chain